MSARAARRVPSSPIGAAAGRVDLLRWLTEPRGQVALLVVDLRRLFTINARLGTLAGDHLIATTLRRLELAAGTGALVAHLGQDDFAVAVADLGETGAVALAERLLVDLQRVVVFEGSVIEPRISIGVATGVDAGESLMEAAVLAVRTAKRRVTSIEVGHSSRLDQALGRNDLMHDLARGIEAREFELHLQPMVDLATGELDGMEALARWRHPVRGLLGPAVFIEPAESSGLILGLGSHLVDLAIELAGRWADRRCGRIWLNLSPLQLADGERLMADLNRVARAGVDPALMGLEITETGVLSDLDGAIAVLEEVRARGFDLALDDFGTGYSSLSYLRRLPVTTLKIDRSFVTGVAAEAADLAIVESVVGLAHALDLRVVAEGVEDRVHAEAVRELGVDVGQGYWFGRPVAECDVPPVHQPWCGRSFSATGGIDAFTRRAQLLYGALDALPCCALVTETIGGRARISAVNTLLADKFGIAPEDLTGRSLDSLSAHGVVGGLDQWKDVTEGAQAAVVRVLANLSSHEEVLDVEVRPFADHLGRAERRLHLLSPAFGAALMGSDRVLTEIDRVADGIVVMDERLTITWINQVMCEMVGCVPQDYVGRSIAEALHPDDLERAIERAVSIRTKGDLRRSRFRVKVNSGGYRWFEMASRLDSAANPGGAVINCHDIQDEVEAEEALARRRSLDEVAAEVSGWALELGPGMFLSELNRVLAAVGGVFDVHIAEVNTFDHGDLLLAATWVRPDQPAETGSDTIAWRNAAARLADEVREVLVVTDLESSEGWWVEAMNAVDVPDQAMLFVPLRSRGNLVGSLHLGVVDSPRAWTDDEVAVARRLGETIAHVIVRERLDDALTRSEAELQHLASHDPLTGLANRVKLTRELTRAMAVGQGEGCAAILLDLDGFKAVNDTAGHEVGDMVLREIAARLMRVAGPANLVCRLGGDEFVVLVPSADIDEARVVAHSLVDATRVPIVDISGTSWQVGASAGVAHGRAADADDMLRAADRAMYVAKRSGGSAVECVRLAASAATEPAPGDQG